MTGIFRLSLSQRGFNSSCVIVWDLLALRLPVLQEFACVGLSPRPLCYSSWVSWSHGLSRQLLTSLSLANVSAASSGPILRCCCFWRPLVDSPGTRLDRWVLAPSHRHHHHHHHRRSCLRISIAPCVACRQSIMTLAWPCCLALDAWFDARLDPPADPDLSLLILNLDLLALVFLLGKLVGSWKVGVPWAVKNDGEDGKLVWSL